MKKPSIGTWISLPQEAIAEIFANSGYEWIVVDLEHSAITINQAEKLIRVIDLAGSQPLVRMSGHSSAQIKRVLDAGASGIIAPMVNSKKQGEAIIESCFYPPSGSRGMGLARAQGYGRKKIRDDYINEKCKKIKIFFQIESKNALDNIDDIFSLKIDGYFIGPYDLSASLGSPGNFNSKEFRSAEDKIMNAANKRNLIKGIHLVEPEAEEIKRLAKRGYNYIAYSVDIRMIENASNQPFTGQN